MPSQREQTRCSERLELVETSVFDTIKSDTFDWIVSNPPYIAEDDQRVVDDVRRFEPAVALFAQSNGLAVIEEIAGGAKRLLGEHGRLIVEHGDRQSLAVQRSSPSMGLIHVPIKTFSTGCALLRRGYDLY